METALVVVAVLVVLTALAGYAIARADDSRPIHGSGDMTRADAEARARSAGIDHITPPSQ
jgi:hypothetical protein